MRRALSGLALVLCMIAPRTAQAWCQMTSSDVRPSTTEPCVLVENHPGTYPLAWRRRCTEISLSSALPAERVRSPLLTSDDVREVLGRSIATWTNVTCGGATTGLAVTVLADTNACSAASHYRGGRNVHTIVFVDRGWATERMHDPRALAVTYVWHDPASGEILDADMELNEELKDFHVCALTSCADVVSVDSSVADLENTLTHEMGHYFGIAHTPDPDSATMWSEARPGETTKRDLETDDIDALCAIYPAGSLPAACDPTPTGGLGLDCLPPPGCGCSVPGRRGAGAIAGIGLLAFALVLTIRRRRA